MRKIERAIACQLENVNVMFNNRFYIDSMSTFDCYILWDRENKNMVLRGVSGEILLGFLMGILQQLNLFSEKELSDEVK